MIGLICFHLLPRAFALDINPTVLTIERAAVNCGVYRFVV